MEQLVLPQGWQQILDVYKRQGLTGLYNRQTFNQLVDDYLKEEFSVARYDAYMIVDLDDFKSINDTLGHSYGDEVIQRVADILENNCYESGYVGRFGRCV